mmetsp:Transcript_60616/g.172268  ORF Transcript_60616/g.172268 Transcript_60616/m.172268 type:complete len:245 (+) Transcript_60616:725-1459(+)
MAVGLALLLGGRWLCQPHVPARGAAHEHLPDVDGGVVHLHVLTLLLLRGVEPLVAGGPGVLPGVPLHRDARRLHQLLLQVPLLGRAHCAHLHLLAQLTLLLAASLGADVQQREGVPQHLLLHYPVQLRLSGEGGRVIDLQEPGLQLVVQHDVEAEHLEAHGVLRVVRLAAVVEVREARLHGDQGLDDQVLDLRDQGVDVVALPAEVLVDGLPAPLVAVLRVIGIGVLLKVWVHFVDRIVCEVNH